MVNSQLRPFGNGTKGQQSLYTGVYSNFACWLLVPFYGFIQIITNELIAMPLRTLARSRLRMETGKCHRLEVRVHAARLFCRRSLT